MRRRRLDRNCWLIEPSSIFHGLITSVGVGSPAKRNETGARTQPARVSKVDDRRLRSGGGRRR